MMKFVIILIIMIMKMMMKILPIMMNLMMWPRIRKVFAEDTHTHTEDTFTHFWVWLSNVDVVVVVVFVCVLMAILNSMECSQFGFMTFQRSVIVFMMIWSIKTDTVSAKFGKICITTCY